MRIKVLTILLAGMLGSLPMMAGDHGEMPGGPGEVAVLGIGGQNRTWSGYGGGALQATIPITEKMSLKAGLQGLSSGVMTGLLQFQPAFPFSKGELFIDASAYYGGFYKYHTGEWLAAAGAGWRAAHFSAQLGLSVRWIAGGSDVVVEPIDLFYRIAGSLNKADAQWNLTAGVANFTHYQVERAMQPIFFIEGRYTFTSRLSLIGEIDVKPAGMFHLTATWYGFSAALGLSYRIGL